MMFVMKMKAQQSIETALLQGQPAKDDNFIKVTFVLPEHID